jgi:hypothetical protein
MSWHEVAASLQLLAEERYGAPTRARLIALHEEEERAASRAREAAE